MMGDQDAPQGPPSVLGSDELERDTLALSKAMTRYAAGDDAALPQVEAVIAPRLYAFLSRLGCSAEQAHQLTERAIERAALARGSFVSRGQAMPWFFAIARTAFRDQMGDGPLPLSRPEAPSGGLHDGKWLIDTVAACLAELPLPLREAFVLLRYEGFSADSAARIVGIGESELRQRAFAAYGTLCRALPRSVGKAQYNP